MKKKLYNTFVYILIAAAFNITYAVEGKQPHSGLIVKRNHEIILNIGKTKERHAPFSTFKVPLALMGFDAKILESKDSPKWAFREEYEKNFQSWYTREKGLEYHWCQDHTPLTFMKNSVVWFSHLITQKLGKEKFEEYVSRLNYGNGNVSGTPGMDDGLFNSWLGTSLEISPLEQVELLEKLLANDLPFSKDAMEKTREIMDRDEVWDGWKLYGKTGGGSGGNGWFIGWIEKDGQRLVFAQYLDKADPGLDLTGLPVHKSVGLTAKEMIKRDVLKYLGESGDK